MSNKAMTWAIDCKVKGSHKLVLMLLADAHNGHTGACFPSQDWIAEHGGIGVSTVQNCLKDLEKWKLITRETARLGRGKGSRTEYVLHTSILDPSNLDLLNSGNRPLKSENLDPQISGVPYKEEPEIEPEVTGNTCAKKVAEQLWDDSPPTARKRTSKAKISTALKAALKKIDADRLLKAYQAYLKDPDVRKNNYQFAKGTHTWLTGEHWDGYLQPESDLLDQPAQKMTSLEQCFQLFAATGRWDGGNHGYRWRPDQEQADYPKELYTRFGVKCGAV
jgi:DNA-binding Lrp family transcriptional regulator